MTELEGIKIGELKGKIVVQIGTKVALINTTEVPRFLDSILKAAKLATDYNKANVIVVPGDDI